jgi:hypothetical protein
LDFVSKDRKKLDSRSKKDKKKGKSSRNISSDEDEPYKIKKGSRYSSDENSSFYTSESDSDHKVMVHHIIILVKGQKERRSQRVLKRNIHTHFL